jgi:DNA-binding NarL/FixJ family response regulator
MDAINQILILASPGHYRDSLVALLRTLPRTDLILSDFFHSGSDSLNGMDPLSKDVPITVLVDLDSALAQPASGDSITARLASIKSIWPRSRLIILVDNLQHTREAQKLGVDCILPRSISAGEFLGAVQELNSHYRHIAWPQPTFSFPYYVDRLSSGLAGR